jgi:hypothetical protein
MGTVEMTPDAYKKLRKYIFGIYMISGFGLVAELLLLEHFDGFWQLLPLVLITISLIIIFWQFLSKNAASRKASQSLMLLMILAGCWGLWMHYSGNTEFELELHPSSKGFTLFWDSITGATPVLAPGAIVGLGLTGLVFTIMTSSADV